MRTLLLIQMVVASASTQDSIKILIIIVKHVLQIVINAKMQRNASSAKKGIICSSIRKYVNLISHSILLTHLPFFHF